jgi:hypothetical protein
VTTSQYWEADGLVYGILQCHCNGYLGVDIKCADLKGNRDRVPHRLRPLHSRSGVHLLGVSLFLADCVVVPTKDTRQ